MTLRDAQAVCRGIEARYSAWGAVKWSDIFVSEQEIVEALQTIYVPANRVAPTGTFTGYELIYSFARCIQCGKQLTERQMTQCKRLALQIKKASAISDYIF